MMQYKMDCLSQGCDNFGLTFSTKKAEATYQPAPGKPSRNHTLWLRGVEHVEEWCASMPMSTTGLLRPASPLEDCVRMSGSEEVSASPLS